MGGRGDEAWADGPATDRELGMGGDDEPTRRWSDADLKDPLVGPADAEAEPRGDADEGYIDDETGHGDEGPLGKEI